MAQTASIDPQAAAAYQFHGQDVPWLVDHWAEHQPDNPFLIWEPKDGPSRSWTYAEFAEAGPSRSPPVWPPAASASATWC